MIVGDRATFAIESEITEAFRSISQLALGYFVVHIKGQIFGVREPDASMLGCSFVEVSNRVARRGCHTVPDLADIDATSLAEAYLDVEYRSSSRTNYFGVADKTFSRNLHAQAVIWAPDGDEAFDDGSHILHFDVGNKVRLIAFINTDAPEDMVATIREAWMDADIFYAVLSAWKEWFATERILRLQKADIAKA